MFIALLNNSGIAHTVAEMPAGKVPANAVELSSFDESKIGQRWDGAAFVAPPVDAATAALAELVAIDRETGMSRLLRETLIAIAGTNAPAKLVEAEAKAAVERGKLAK